MTIPVPTAAAHGPGRPSRRRALLVVGLLVLAAAAATGWWVLRPVPPVPPMPEGIEDPEVERVVVEARRPALDDPRSADAWGQYGKVLLAQLFDQEADACFAEAARLDPSDPRWPYGRAAIALKRRPAEAPALLRQTLAAAGDAWPVYRSVANLRLAETLLENNELDAAAERFRAEQQYDPQSPHAALGLGLIAQARGDNAAAAELLSQARGSPSARKHATMQLAALARARGDTAAAVRFDREIAALPADVAWADPFMDEIATLRVGQRAFERRVRQLEGARRHAEAAELYLERIKQKPSAELYVGAGINLARLREYDRAVPLLREAVRLDPNSAQAQYSLALVLFTRAEHESQTAPGGAAARALFGEAAEHARRAAEIRPGHAKSYLFWGMALKHLGEPQAALAPLKLGIACTPSDLELQLGMGQALVEAGRGKEAVPYLETAARLAPANDTRAAQALAKLRGEHGTR